jgi:hypothetical protein
MAVVYEQKLTGIVFEPPANQLPTARTTISTLIRN